jgi:hypothetical protein
VLCDHLFFVFQYFISGFEARFHNRKIDEDHAIDMVPYFKDKTTGSPHLLELRNCKISDKVLKVLAVNGLVTNTPLRTLLLSSTFA